MRSFMSAEEISRLVKALSELGVCKIRLTGGVKWTPSQGQFFS